MRELNKETLLELFDSENGSGSGSGSKGSEKGKMNIK